MSLLFIVLNFHIKRGQYVGFTPRQIYDSLSSENISLQIIHSVLETTTTKRQPLQTA